MSQDDNVIIIGAGASGIAMGCQLQRELGFTNFEIYERGGEFGGVWYFNTYPGCGCDIPSHFYSFSFEKNPNWTEVFPMQPEIQQYILNVCKKYNLDSHTHFRTECIGAEWNQNTERWSVTFKNLKTGEVFTKTSKFVVMCAGGLSTPNPCPVPGIENFKGHAWHSTQWNHKVDITDKNVIVIGNGCSAAQFVPVILPKVKSLSQFIRSQHWIFYRPNWKYSEKFKWVMRNIPGAISFHRFLWAAFLDVQFGMFNTKYGKWLRTLVSNQARKYMMSKSPKKYHDILIPKFEVGAKRRIFDADYIECLNDPKILLTDDPLVQIQERSVLTKSGKEYPADIIVYANGFQLHEPMANINIRGKSGEALIERWRRQSGMRGYMGTTISDFPNMFLIVGPNTASGHYSIIYMAECNVNYSIKLMKPFLGTGRQGSIVVKEEAEKRYNNWIQNRLRDYIWGYTGEAGWYIDKNTGHNGIVYPHYQFHYWVKSLKPKWSDFEMNGNKPINIMGKLSNLFLFILVLFGILMSWLLLAGK